MLFSAPLFASDIEGLRVFVRMDKRNFYSNEDVSLTVVIKNISRENIAFHVYDSSGKNDIYGISRGDDSDFITFRPIVYDVKGRTSEVVVPYVKRSENITDQLKWMNRRDIVLGAGESFTHRQKLNRIYKLEPEKRYRVRLKFFPFPGTKGNESLLSSNEVSFVHKIQKRYLREGGLKEERYGLMPSEIVMLLLNSEMEGNWERALKYIDVERFIRSYPAFSREYFAGDDYDKRRIRMDFLRFLAINRQDALLDFKIVNEEIDSDGISAVVEVVALRKTVVSPDRFKYRYRLIKKDRKDLLWSISGVEASVMKGVVK